MIIQNNNKVTRANKYAHILEGTYKSHRFSLVSIEILLISCEKQKLFEKIQRFLSILFRNKTEPKPFNEETEVMKSGWFVKGILRVKAFVIAVYFVQNNVSNSLIQWHLVSVWSRGFLLTWFLSKISERNPMNQRTSLIQFALMEKSFLDSHQFGMKCFNCLKNTFSSTIFFKQWGAWKKIFGSKFQISSQSNFRKILVSCSICCLEFYMSKISSIQTSANLRMIKSLENKVIYCVKTFGRHSRSQKVQKREQKASHLMKTEPV